MYFYLDFLNNIFSQMSKSIFVFAMVTILIPFPRLKERDFACIQLIWIELLRKSTTTHTYSKTCLLHFVRHNQRREACTSCPYKDFWVWCSGIQIEIYSASQLHLMKLPKNFGMSTKQCPCFSWVQGNTQYTGQITIHLNLMNIISSQTFFKLPLGHRFFF